MELYFNAYTIAMLICCLFSLIIVFYLLIIKNKSNATIELARFFVGAFLLNFGFLVASLLPYPEGGYHRFITVGSVFIPLIFMIQFAYNFPRVDNFWEEAQIAKWISVLAALILILDFTFRAIMAEPRFNFTGNLYDFPELGKLAASFIIIYLLWFIFVMIRKAIKYQGEERTAVIQLMLALLIPTMLPGIFNQMYKNGTMEPGAFQIVFVTCALLGFFVITIVFINNAVEQTSFMTKIVGISVVTILMVVQVLTTAMTLVIDDNFNYIYKLETESVISSGKYKKVENLNYVVSYPENITEKNQVTVIYQKEGVKLNKEDLLADKYQVLNKETGKKEKGATGILVDKKKGILLSPENPRHFRNMSREGNSSDNLHNAYLLKKGDRIYEAGFSYISYRKFVDESARLISYILLILIALILILYPIFFSRSLVRPLNALLDGVSEVNVGNLEVRIPVMVQDEIGYLSNSFNKMVRSILDSKNRLQDYTNNLEHKVNERTREVTERMEEVHALKVQQDGDYFLTALIQIPLVTNWNKSRRIDTEIYIDQKKKFTFRQRKSQLGGDICVTGNLRFGEDGTRHTVFMNGDAMGKSMQGAGGAIVLGTAMNNILARSAGNDRILDISPTEWLTRTYRELHNVFLTFDGVMLVSAAIGVINERTGEMYYFNAEHPWTVLYRKGKASFIESELVLRKLGSPSEFPFKVRKFQLEPEDVLIAGSDGRDDINISPNSEERTINEDETLFLDLVEKAGGKLQNIVDLIYGKGAITDDLSLIRVAFMNSPTPMEYMSEEDAGEALKLLEHGKRNIKAGNINVGIRELESAVQLKPNLEQGLQLLAQVSYEIKDFESAARWIEEYLELQPGAANFWFYLSVCAKHLKDFEKARNAGEKVKEYQPERVANLVNLADSYRMLGDIEKSRIHVEKVLKLEPENVPARKLAEKLSQAN